MSKKIVSQDKRNNVKTFLDFVYENTVIETDINLNSILNELKRRTLSSEYLTALKISRLIDKVDGKIKWINDHKPTMLLTDLIISLTTNIINKRNTTYKIKNQENVFKFLRCVYRTLKFGRPAEKDKFDIEDILKKYNLKIAYRYAILDKGFIKQSIILMGSKQSTIYIWNSCEPSMEDALKLYNYVNNMKKLKIKKTNI